MNDRNVEAIYPLAPSQHGMLLYLVMTDRSDTDRPDAESSDAYFEQFVCEIAGPLDPALFRRAWERLVERHPALRTFFLWERRERPLQVVARAIETPFEVADWRHLAAERQESDFAAFAAADKSRLFALDRPPLLRFHLFRLGEERWRLLWSYSHLLIDGWSLAALFSEAFETYRRLAAGEALDPRPAVPFKRFVDWAEKQDPSRAEAYFRGALQDLELPTVLPCDRDPGARIGSRAAHSSASARIERHLGELGGRLEELARAHRVTASVVYQAAFGLLLHAESGESCVVYGGVSSGRPPKLPGVEEIVGVFVNALPFRSDWQPGLTLRELFAALQRQLLEQQEFENVRGSEIGRWLGLPFDRPLFEHAFVFENYPRVRTPPGLEASIRELPEVTSHALMLYVEPEESGVLLRLVYDTRRFAAADAERIFGRYLHLLETFVAQAGAPAAAPRVGELPLLTAAEVAAALALGDGGSRPAATTPVCRLFETRARLRPEAIAVESLDGAQRLSYGELDRQADDLARQLLARGVRREEAVLVALGRSPELIAVLLAIHKAGAAYLPLDPGVPAARLAALAADAGVRFGFLGAKAEAKLREAGITPGFALLSPAIDGAADTSSEATPLPELPLSSLAYVIYTSGSTGEAKGVQIEHAQLAHYTADAAEVYQLAENDRALQFASLGFDTSAEEIWPALAAGATLVLRDEEMIASPAIFLERLAAAEISLLNLPTAYWHELCAELGEAGGSGLPACVRGVIIGGEAASPERLERWLTRLEEDGRQVPLWNTYGPTETTIVATRARLDGWTPEQYGGEVPIGRPIANLRATVVDRDGRLRPPGLPGELRLAGAGVARGYLGRPGLSADRFLAGGAAPSLAPGAGRLYATGDRVVQREDGTLLFRGRIDQQVKVRGYRVEPGEIENALRRHPGVEDAVVQLRPLAGEPRLVAWLVAADPARPPAAAELRAFLAAGLPEYMVPAAFLMLGAFPLTSSGKIDRRTLPTPDASLLAGSAGAENRPRTPVEELLAALWCELLGVAAVSRDDDFFRLGGHSLLVGRMTSRLRKQLGVELPLVAVFEDSTLAALAKKLERALKGDDGDSAAALPPIERVPRDGRPLPLSYPQERVWLIHQLEPRTIAYNFQATFSFDGRLDVAALEAALTEIVRRHEVFRTRFPAQDGRAVMVIEEPFAITLPITDLSHLPVAAANRRAEEILEEETRVPFELDRLPLIRWRLLRLAADRHQLIQLEHHFVHDGWSLSVLLRELTALYRAYAAGQGSPLAELEVQYADFAYWQRRVLEGRKMGDLVGWWRKNLEGMPTVLELPFDRPRPEQPSSRGASKNFLLPSKLYGAIKQFSREQGFTLYMTMLAGFSALLYRYTGRTDFGIGGGVANRRQQAQQGLIGMIVNSVVLRCRMEGDPTFLELVRRMRRTSIEAYEHQDMPFEKLVSELRPERHPSRNPLFQVMFSFHDAAVPELDFGSELEVRGLVRTNRSAKLDLNVILSPQAEQRVGQENLRSAPLAIFTWEYNRDLFDDATMKRMMRHYLDLLAEAVARPEQRLSQLAITGAAERSAIQEASYRPSGAPRDASLAALFAAAAARHPDVAAVKAGEGRLTSRELASRSTRLAELLLEAGAAPGEAVGLAVERGLDLPLGMLGILKAGGAYAPLDPSYPAERLAAMAEDLGLRQVVAQRHLAERLVGILPAGVALLDLDAHRESLAAAPEGRPLPETGGGFPAYVLYTSGSTGRPKGVTIPQRAVARLVLGTDYVRLGPGGSALQIANANFDAVTFEIWAPLLNGGLLVVIDRETLLSPADLEAALARQPVDAAFVTTAYFQQLVRERPGVFGHLRQVLFGGERCEPALVREALGLGIERLLHVYGPTECTTFATWLELRELPPGATSVPIGRPLAGTETYVLDRDGQLCPAGIPGELYLGGDGLALGYHRRPSLTAETFVPHPFSPEPGARLYRTGDLVKRLPGGELDFLGRRDDQVKLRGFRIELGEVEAALARLPEVAAAVVILREDRPGEKRLVGYVEPRPGGEPEPGELRAALRRGLPEFMVPSEVMVLARFPQNANGKIDRRALPPPELRAAAADFAPPENAAEQRLAEVFAELLGVARVGRDDDFFALGGHSLTATLLASRVGALFGRKLPLSQIFATPRLDDLARALENLPRLDEEAPIGRGAAEADLAAQAEGLGDAELDALLGQLQEEKSC